MDKDNIMESVFIVTKPLQYVNCTNIPDNSPNKVCFLCENFANAPEFSDIVKSISTYFNKCSLFKSKMSALLYVCLHQNTISKLYLDADFGLSVRFLLLFLVKIDVFTYEEGYASYNYLRKPDSSVNKILLFISKCLGIKNWIGGSSKVKGVFLYDHDLFKQNIPLKDYSFLRSFKVSFLENISNSKEMEYLSQSVNYKQFDEQNVVIYLSAWSISNNLKSYMQGYFSYYKVVKLHPHIQESVKIDVAFDYSLPASILIEYFISKVLNHASLVHIIHHGTFGMKYLDVSDLKITQTVISE